MMKWEDTPLFIMVFTAASGSGDAIKKNVREAVIKRAALFLFEADRDDELAFDIHHNGRSAQMRILGKESRTKSSPLRIFALQTGRSE